MTFETDVGLSGAGFSASYVAETGKYNYLQTELSMSVSLLLSIENVKISFG